MRKIGLTVRNKEDTVAGIIIDRQDIIAGRTIIWQGIITGDTIMEEIRHPFPLEVIMNLLHYKMTFLE